MWSHVDPSGCMSRLFGYYIIYDELTDDFDNGLEATSVDDLGCLANFQARFWLIRSMRAASY
jgi:hypothetical protein